MLGDHQNIAVVLPGGNSKGAYQVGVLESLSKVGIKPASFSGVSVGAINAYAASVVGMQNLWSLWRGMGKEDVYGKGGLFRGAYNLLRKGGMRSIEPLGDLLKQKAPGPPRHAAVDIGAYNLGRKRYEVFRSEDHSNKTLHRAVLASAAIPVLAQPVKIGASHYLDGGVMNVAPISSAIRRKPDFIIIVATSDAKERTPWDVPDSPGGYSPIVRYRGVRGLLNIGDRVIHGVTNEVLTGDIASFTSMNKLLREAGSGQYIPYALIEPSESLGAGEDFSLIPWRYELGLQDAIPQLSRVLDDLNL